ncbi:YraN family protein [bacterium]|nr:YraN family protein [bacterium]
MSVNKPKANNRIIGNNGEKIACTYLEKLGYLIQDRNYNKKWGELDIVAVKDNILHFFEVKSMRTVGNSIYRPEENVHNLKQKRLRRTIQTYLNEHKAGIEPVFKFHVIIVKMNIATGESDIEMLENIIL